MPDSLQESPERAVPALDHAVVMLEPESYRQVLESRFVQEDFGRFRVKQADSSLASHYTAVGIGGVNTLIELFDASAPPIPGLTGALVLSFQFPGAIGAARRRLERASLPFEAQLVERTVDGHEERMPWYELVQPDLGDDSPFRLMLAEVQPGYFDHIGARRGPDDSLPRSAYLDAAMGKSLEPHHRLADVIGLTIRLEPGRADRVRRVLEVLGYAKDASGGWLEWEDTRIRILDSESEPEGFVEIETALRRGERLPGTLRFGHAAELMFPEEGLARWRFDPPEPADPPPSGDGRSMAPDGDVDDRTARRGGDAA